jgi:predicted solute-binding protein
LEKQSAKTRVGAVSYLNTVPLVWGMLHGAEREQVDLSFSIPSVCARRLEQGEIEVGLVPVAEIARQGLETVPGVGICCRGAVRSILLFSRVPWKQVQTLAADVSSRTSVELARIILRERFGVQPQVASREPRLLEMLSEADAALIIGDPALRIDPQRETLESLDLGAEWLALTGLPMVFALWAGKPGIPSDQLSTLLRRSYAFGRKHFTSIVEQEHSRRGIPLSVAEHYLYHCIRFDLGPEERKGMEAFLALADLPRPALSTTA